MELHLFHFFMRKLPDLQAWAIFAKLAETGSFARTAAELGLSQPTVSKAIRKLEQEQNITLLHRSSRKVRLSATGEAALERASRLLLEAQALEDELTETTRQLQGRVRLSAPMSFGLTYLAPLLPAFMRLYPDIMVEVDFSDARSDIIEQGFDLALRISSLEDSSLLSRYLCLVRLHLVASPAYIQQYGAPEHPRDLSQHRILRYSQESTPLGWRFHHEQAGWYSPSLPEVLRVNNAHALLPALHAGLGIALQPEFLVWEDCEQDKVRKLMPQWRSADLALHVLSPPGRARPARVQVLQDFLVAHLAQAPWATALSLADTAQADGPKTGQQP